MNLLSNHVGSLILGVGGLAPLVGAGGLVTATPQFEAAVAEEKEIEGSITSVGMDDSFVVTDEGDNAHSITTNEKTGYMLDGEEATRAQVVVKGAKVNAKVNEDGLALKVNRITQ